jgi:hypothetical protein
MTKDRPKTRERRKCGLDDVFHSVFDDGELDRTERDPGMPTAQDAVASG